MDTEETEWTEKPELTMEKKEEEEEWTMEKKEQKEDEERTMEKKEEEEWTMDKLLGFGRFHYFQIWVVQALVAVLGMHEA